RGVIHGAAFGNRHHGQRVVITHGGQHGAVNWVHSNIDFRAKPSPTRSPLNSMGASSFLPYPMTTVPSMCTVYKSPRIASTAEPSAMFLSPKPTHSEAPIAEASVTRTSSIARLRSWVPAHSSDWAEDLLIMYILP